MGFFSFQWGIGNMFKNFKLKSRKKSSRKTIPSIPLSSFTVGHCCKPQDGNPTEHLGWLKALLPVVRAPASQEGSCISDSFPISLPFCPPPTQPRVLHLLLIVVQFLLTRISWVSGPSEGSLSCCGRTGLAPPRGCCCRWDFSGPLLHEVPGLCGAGALVPTPCPPWL